MIFQSLRNLLLRKSGVVRGRLHIDVAELVLHDTQDKGGGEGGRMIALAALASAVEDALTAFGVRIDELPMTPERIATLVEEARRRR